MKEAIRKNDAFNPLKKSERLWDQGVRFRAILKALNISFRDPECD